MTDNRTTRDAATDALLRRAFEAPQADAPTPECLDAETLAAWADDGLSGPARESAESHVAGCARCQAVLAALVRTEPAAVAPAPQRSPRWTLAWLVPVAAAAAVVVWFAIPARETLPGVPVPEAPAAANAALPAQAGAAELKAPAATPNVAAAKPAKKTDTSAALDKLAKAAAPAASPVQKSEAARGGGITSGLMPAAPPAVVGGTAAEPVAQPRAASERPVGSVLSSVTRDGAVQWRVTGSVVSRSIDRGATWSSFSTGIDAEWTAVSAPSASTCWLAGKGGVVALTTDGRTWRRLTSPIAADLTLVQADDEKAATVTTVDGRRFRTTDSGVTWVRVQGIAATPF